MTIDSIPDVPLSYYTLYLVLFIGLLLSTGTLLSATWSQVLAHMESIKVIEGIYHTINNTMPIFEQK